MSTGAKILAKIKSKLPCRFDGQTQMKFNFCFALSAAFSPALGDIGINLHRRHLTSHLATRKIPRPDQNLKLLFASKGLVHFLQLFTQIFQKQLRGQLGSSANPSPVRRFWADSPLDGWNFFHQSPENFPAWWNRPPELLLPSTRLISAPPRYAVRAFKAAAVFG